MSLRRGPGRPKGSGRQSCKVPDCDGDHHAQGFCNSHYRRWLRWQARKGKRQPKKFKRMQDPVERRG